MHDQYMTNTTGGQNFNIGLGEFFFILFATTESYENRLGWIVLDGHLRNVFFLCRSEINRPFYNNCGPTFIWDICEWKNYDIARKIITS